MMERPTIHFTRAPGRIPGFGRPGIVSVLVGVVVVGIGLTAPAADASNAAVIASYDVGGTTFFNPCTSENVTITSGTLHVVAHATTDEAGGYHVTIRGNAQDVVASGDASGQTYRLAGDFWGEQNGGADGSPLVLQLVEVHNVLSEGPGSNVIMHIVTHVTVNANGVVSVEIDSLGAECRG